MLKVEVQYVDFGNIEALPLASLREPTRAISHVNSLPFQVLHPTCLYVLCSSPPPSLLPLTDTPLHLPFVVSPPVIFFPFRYPTPTSYCVCPLLLSSLMGTLPYLSFFPLTLSSYKYPTPLVLLCLPPLLVLFPYRYPSLIVFLFPTSLCSL